MKKFFLVCTLITIAHISSSEKPSPEALSKIFKEQTKKSSWFNVLHNNARFAIATTMYLPSIENKFITESPRYRDEVPLGFKQAALNLLINKTRKIYKQCEQDSPHTCSLLKGKLEALENINPLSMKQDLKNIKKQAKKTGNLDGISEEVQNCILVYQFLHDHISTEIDHRFTHDQGGISNLIVGGQ